ncbi:DNA-3-methyladenine glycosylase [Deinococcus humi]|uniref:Putative 3-methyladenine DNA glycosylase n=1 Tax=Deinococcus humi TaxID=662880 RepID=A0A7W8NCW3_9DEIO|nr:DNA-3-methyladenine glycosylase [Deinococcus humi]MBB5361726.1 DNA-3-methyladenine glycosylase [Deinococcus humi]GGO23961.1 putative 3-methyladenine DNA glycosylase [Deinococcus humi]
MRSAQPKIDHAHALRSDFFAGDPVAVARALIGAVLVRVLKDGVILAARIVETEGYDCPRDPSCHVIARLPGAAGAMGGEPGRVYFHFAYRQPLLNVVCRPTGIQASILIRAVQPLLGEERMRELRPVRRSLDLSNGPAKLVTALGLTGELGGQPIDSPSFYIVPGQTQPDSAVEITSRVGLRRGADLPWRFLMRGNPWVSPGTPSAGTTEAGLNGL